MKVILNKLESLQIVNNPKNNLQAVIGLIIIITVSVIYLAILVSITLATMFSIIFLLKTLIEFIQANI